MTEPTNTEILLAVSGVRSEVGELRGELTSFRGHVKDLKEGVKSHDKEISEMRGAVRLFKWGALPVVAAAAWVTRHFPPLQ